MIEGEFSVFDGQLAALGVNVMSAGTLGSIPNIRTLTYVLFICI